MRLLPIDRVVEGMPVAKPVVHASGRILLAPGVSLTGRMIERLRNHGVGQIWVEVEGPDEGRWSAEKVRQMERALERRFAHVQHDPLMQQIQAIVRKRIRSRAGGEVYR